MVMEFEIDLAFLRVSMEPDEGFFAVERAYIFLFIGLALFFLAALIFARTKDDGETNSIPTPTEDAPSKVSGSPNGAGSL